MMMTVSTPHAAALHSPLLVMIQLIQSNCQQTYKHEVDTCPNINAVTVRPHEHALHRLLPRDVGHCATIDGNCEFLGTPVAADLPNLAVLVEHDVGIAVHRIEEAAHYHRAALLVRGGADMDRRQETGASELTDALSSAVEDPSSLGHGHHLSPNDEQRVAVDVLDFGIVPAVAHGTLLKDEGCGRWGDVLRTDGG